MVNSAGLGHLKPVTATSLDDVSALVAVNIVAPVRLSMAVLPKLLSRNDGAIITIASVLSVHTLPVSALYSGTKGFIMNLARGIQEEVAGTKVRAQIVFPATTATEIWDHAQMPISSHDPKIVMSAEAMVDAALTAFDQGEDITWPSVHEAGRWLGYDEAPRALFSASQTGEVAPRYRRD